MNKQFKIAALALLAMMSTGAFAADTQNLTVNASVTGVCKFTSVATTLGFGALDPSNAVVPTAPTATITYKCTKGTASSSFTVGGSGASPFSGTMVGVTLATDTLPFQITFPAFSALTGAGFGGAVAGASVTLTGVILYANYANLSAQSYTATVALAVNP